jgi:putative transposase
MSIGIKEDRYAEEEIQARGDCREAETGRCSGVAGAEHGDAIRQIGVSEVTFYRWRQEFGGLKTDQVKRLKDLELENSRLRKAVSDLTLDKLILTEAAKGNF